MLMRQVMDVMSLCEGPRIREKEIRNFFLGKGASPDEIETTAITGKGGSTLFIKLRLRGSPAVGGIEPAPPLGIIGRLGGIGARPHAVGLVSDADGAICALSAASELAEARKRGDGGTGDVIIATHLCPDAPVTPHDPVPFMGAPPFPWMS